jgi:hypothetical protein
MPQLFCKSVADLSFYIVQVFDSEQFYPGALVVMEGSASLADAVALV